MMQQPVPLSIDLNADVGEHTTPQHLATELGVIRAVTSVNIACGGHAGGAASMRHAVRIAAEHNVAVGAHPSFPDRANFGRVPLRLPPEDLRRSIREQLAALLVIAQSEGVPVLHCKPHGALYHAASDDDSIAKAVLQACTDLRADFRLVGQAGSRAVAWWRSWDATVWEEGFVDRVYLPDGTLRTRSEPNALITDEHAAAEQAQAIATKQSVRCEDGSVRSLMADTLCIHADTPNAASIANRVAQRLRAAGVILCPPS